MGLICKLLGHRFDQCRCSRCGAQRDTGHRWVLADGACKRTCSICGKEETIPHDWFLCRCERCGELRDEHHFWLAKSQCEQVCRICGAERETHAWQHVDRGVDRCAVCGKTHRLTPEEIARRDEEWAEADVYDDPFEEALDYPPEPD